MAGASNLKISKKGQDDVQHVCEAISIDIRDRIDPLPEVEMIPLEVEGKKILQLRVHEGHYTPYRKPVFKSSTSQFMTTIYSMEYGVNDGRQAPLCPGIKSVK